MDWIEFPSAPGPERLNMWPAPSTWTVRPLGRVMLRTSGMLVTTVEPEIVSKSFRLSRTPLDYRAGCVTGYEGREPGDSVPHFAPDKNPFVDEFVKLYHLPREAVLGYPETLYPEYRKKIKDSYVPPPPCTESCGAAGNFVLRR